MLANLWKLPSMYSRLLAIWNYMFELQSWRICSEWCKLSKLWQKLSELFSNNWELLELWIWLLTKWNHMYSMWSWNSITRGNISLPVMPTSFLYIEWRKLYFMWSQLSRLRSNQWNVLFMSTWLSKSKYQLPTLPRKYILNRHRTLLALPNL